MSSATIEVHPLDDRGSVAWLLGAADPAQRASSAIVVDAGTLVVDPVDGDGLDGLLSGLPSVIGVVTLLDRHQRDAAVVAERLGAPRLTPLALGGSGVAVDGVEERSVFERRNWRESLLWLPDTAHYANKYLVEVVAVLELLDTNLNSTVPGSVLAHDATAKQRADDLINDKVPAMADAGAFAVDHKRAYFLSDPEGGNPLAYQGLSFGLYGRAVQLLGARASDAAKTTLRLVAQASWGLMGPDGDVAYHGRSQEQAWTLGLTANGAEACVLACSEPDQGAPRSRDGRSRSPPTEPRRRSPSPAPAPRCTTPSHSGHWCACATCTGWAPRGCTSRRACARTYATTCTASTPTRAWSATAA